MYITIKSTQTVDKDSDTTELFTCGKLESYNGGYRLRYDESEATGFEGSSVTLDVNPDCVIMKRDGKAPSTLVIERGKKHHCHYGTEFGDFMIGIFADDVQTSLQPDGGSVYLKYTLDINSSYMSENEMQIDVSYTTA